MNSQYDSGKFEPIAKDVKDALKVIKDFQKLGKCNLKNLNLLFKHNKEISLKTTDIGRTICETLKEAHEGMRGSGYQSREAPDWKYYNILYYRYFRYNYKNEQIVALLGYESTRSYFRDRQKAIEILLAKLLEMEDSSSQKDNV